jgi:trehalose-phosphatase
VSPEAIAERIAGLPRPLLLAFDVDGTLAPIVDDPDAARVPAEVRQLLTALAERPGIEIALVTGRDARSLSTVVRVAEAYRSLEHGRLVLAPGESVRRRRSSARDRERLHAFEAWARAEAVPRGARLEVKAMSRAVHVRELAATDEAEAAAVLEGARRAARRQGLTPRDGRCVVEAELDLASKADALERIRERADARGVAYVGDDRTDIPALMHAEALGGVGVFVSSPELRCPGGVSAAVDGPTGVRALLDALAERL